MEMMPIMNVFNEWHAANTSKKIRAVKRANAQEGIYTARKAAYGYVKGTDEKKTPIIDEEAALIVRRIFEMRASGISPKKIAETLNDEGILCPNKYAIEKNGIGVTEDIFGLWNQTTVKDILHNLIYLGHLAQLRSGTMSYKNHMRIKKDEKDWIIV